MKFSKDITKATGIDSKRVWRYVRRAGVEPQRIHGVLCITDEELTAFLAAIESGDVEITIRNHESPPPPEIDHESEAMRRRVRPLPPKPVPQARDGYVYIAAVNEVKPWDWAASVGYQS